MSNYGVSSTYGVRSNYGVLDDEGVRPNYGIGSGDSWSPANLFGPNDVGLWYDYAAITPEMLAWRKNLLLNSEFAGAVAGTPGTNPTSWTNSTSTGTIVSAAPGAMRVSAVAGRRNFVQSFTLAPNEVRVLRIEVDITTTVAVNQILGGFGAAVAVSEYFVDGVSFPNTNATPSVGQHTLAVRVTANATGGSVGFQVGVGLQANATADITFLNAQLTLGPSITEPYQRITDFTSDFVAAFPTTAIYQDSTGVTPVTALGQPVGLVLDKSRGGAANLGSELISNGTFAVDTSDWTVVNGTFVASDGRGVLEAGSGIAGIATQSFTTVAGRTYLLTLNAGAASGFIPTIRIGTSSNGEQILVSTALAIGNNQRVFVATTTTTWLTLRTNTASAGAQVNFDNISVREVPGNHAIQSTPTARPVWDARKNTLERTEEFDNAYWTKNVVTVVTNVATAPNGTVTADRIHPSATNGNSATYRIGGSIVNGARYTVSIYASAAGKSWIFLRGINDAEGAWFNVSNGTVGTVQAGITASIVSVGGGWYRCSVAQTSNSVTAKAVFLVTDSDGFTTATANGTDGIFVWGIQSELGSTATSYQRVTTATDYADVGFSRGALFDGSDDFLVTAANLNLSGTDEVTVIVGLDKRSEAAANNVVVELSADINANNGVFVLQAPTASGTNTFNFASKGTSSVSNAPSGALLAPATAVLTGLADISGDINTVRRNGSVVATVTSDQGTGNYGSYLLYMGRRAGSSAPFTGRITQLIIIGRVLTTAELAQVERYVANQSGVLIP